VQACKEHREILAAKEPVNVRGKRPEVDERKTRIFFKGTDVTAGFSWLRYGPVMANVLQVRKKIYKFLEEMSHFGKLGMDKGKTELF
jgi:hypothetical protein